MAYPAQIGIESTRYWDMDDLWKLVRMQLSNRSLQCRITRYGGFNQHWDFSGFFQLALPLIHRNTWRQHIHASRQFFPDQSLGQLFSADAVWEIGEHQYGFSDGFCFIARRSKVQNTFQ